MKKHLLLLLGFIIFSCQTEPNFYSLTINVNPNNSATVSEYPSEYEEGSKVTVNVIANEGYEFDSWSGDATGSDNPLTLKMDRNKNITANFNRELFLDKYDGVSWSLISAVQPSGAGCGDVSCLNQIFGYGKIFNIHSGDYFLSEGTNCGEVSHTITDPRNLFSDNPFYRVVSHTSTEFVWEKRWNSGEQNSAGGQEYGISKLTVIDGQLKYYLAYAFVDENQIVHTLDRVGTVDCNPN
jgi:hypothetical protein